MIELNKVYAENCLQTTARMPDNLVDLIVTSPPYSNLRNYHKFSWDFETIARELYRILKPGGVLVWVVGDKTYKGTEELTPFRHAIYFQDIVGFNTWDTMIYVRQSPFPANVRYNQNFEFMFVFSKGTPKTFNPIMDRKNKWGGQKTFGKSSFRDKDGSLKVSGQREVNKIGKRSNIWRYANGFGFGQSDEIAYQHPATYPEALAKDHILSWSNEGDTVLDCFTGSGTTLKMAKMLNRHYLGIEISPEYVTLAEKRLLATPVPLFGQGRGLTLPAPDGGDSAPSQALSTPDMFSAIEHEPTPAPRR